MANAFDIEGLDDVIARLRRLPKEVSQKRGGPVRAGLRKGGNIIRKRARENVRRITDTPNIGGWDNSTGRLEKSIAVVRGKTSIYKSEERIFVLVPKRVRYPINKRTPTGIGVATIGRMLEYGTERSHGKRHRWMGPAYNAERENALATIIRETLAGIDKLEKQMGSGR